MPGPRLRVHTGCDRCKKRKKKCDETRPQCLYCRKWGFPCVYSAGASLSASRPRSAMVDVGRCHGSLGAGSIDPFHSFSAAASTSNSSCMLDAKLWQVFTGMVNASLPFDFRVIHQRLATGWLEAAFTDAGVSHAFAAYISNVDAKRRSDDSGKLTALHAERNLLRLLQGQIDHGDTKNGLLSLASSIHLSAALVNDFSIARVAALGRGLRTLLALNGEIELQASDIIQDSTLASSRVMGLSISDHLVTFATGVKPLVIDDGPLEVPQSLQEHADGVLSSKAPMPTIELTRALNDMCLAMSFRLPSTYSKPLTKPEATFLFKVLHSTDVQLRWLHYHSQGHVTWEKAVILTLMVLNEVAFRDDIQHAQLGNLLLDQLEVLLVDLMHESDSSLWRCKIAVWACLAATSRLQTRPIFDRICQEQLQQLQGLDECRDVADLKATMRAICHEFLWHPLLDNAIDSFEF